ncbi:transcription factor 20-like isoform X2 [Mixophyes fleayi]|uniref:transcription factor 20-like isoform X2 n=1 Tax=Mixophyes fleayi TaxID=3061075 RepID=UPI003F4D7827
MQSFRDQRNYHGNQQTYPPEAHGPSRMEEYSLRQQAPMFQSSYGGRREGTVSPTTMALGENSNLQSYQGYRKESDDFYYLGNKGCPPGDQTPHRRPPGPLPTYGPPQGNSSSNSTGFISHYGREGHHSHFAGQHSPVASLSQYSQDFPRSFSPGSGQYTAHVPNQQLRQRYQSHQPLPQSGKPPASIGTSHVQQLQRSASLSSPALYPLPVGHFEQHYQSPAGSTSTSFPLQRFSGTNYEGYSPGGPSSPYESPVSGSSDGTQQGYSSYASQHLKSFDAAKMPQGGGQGQSQKQNPPNAVQYSNASKLLPQSQTGQYNQSEVPVRSPMQFQQSFSPISNPSPAASAVQSPSCSSTPSPLMTSGENIQCGQGNVPFPSRNRALPMSQLSPNTHICNFKDFGVEGSQEKCLADPGLCSLSALSSQLANLPNTVQHVLLSDAVAPHTKGGKRTSKKTDICANSETSSQSEEQLKSPVAESLDGSCSSWSGDPGKRVRQLSGQSTSSKADVKGLPSEKPTSPDHEWQNEPIGKIATQKIDTVLEPVESFQEIPKVGEKSVGVIVSIETVANRSEKIEDPTPVNDKPTQEPELLETVNKEIAKNFINSQNGEPNIAVPLSITTAIISQIEAAKSPVDTAFGSMETPATSRNPINISQHPKLSDTESVGGQSDRKPRKSDKYPSLLQEVLQGHHQQERRYARNTQEHPAVTGGPDVPLRPNVLMNQASNQSNHSILGKTLATHLESPHWEKKHNLEMKPMNLTDYPVARKLEAEPPNSCHEQSGGPSERRSVICDISPLRQLVREPTSSHVGAGQERSPNGRAGQSVILPSGMLFMDKSNIQRVVAKGKDIESQKVPRKRTVEQCVPYTPKDSTWVNTSQRSMSHDPSQEYSSYKSHISNTKRGTGRAVSRGRSPTKSQELSDWLKMSPGTSRGPKEVHNMNPTMSLSERASRDALYSAFFQNTDSSTLGYHTNFRSSSYGESNPTFNSPLHYKRQIYQQDEYKERLGSSSQAIRSTLQHCREVQQKSPRQEPFHICSPGRSENEGLGYSQSSYQESSNIDYIQQVCIGEGTPNSTNVELKQNSQKIPPGESPSWHLGRQASPVKKVDSPMGTNQKPFGPIRETETHGPRPGESIELPKLGCNAHRLSGTEEVSHHNPLIMRRRVRSFISPIPSKRQMLEDKGSLSASTLQELSYKTTALHVLLPRGKDDESSISGPEQRCPQAVSLSSPTKSKILPPRKGRGLKLEAIVQKITSPNVRRTAAPSGIESAVEPVTLDDILSLKEKGSEFMQEAERTVDVVPAISSNEGNEEIKMQGLFTKSFVAWTIHDNKQIKKETDDQCMVTKEFPQFGPLIQQTPKHFMEVRGNTPALELKCLLPQVQPSEVSDKEKLVTPKQERTPPKGYFPSGKKKGRPIGSVSKQKKLQQQQFQQKQQSGQEQQLQSSVTGGLISPLPPPPKTHSVSEQGLDSEPKPKRRLRERSKEAGTRRRVKQAVPIVAPIEPEIILKYASQSIDRTENKAKSFFPYIHMEIKEELGLSCVIFNAEEEEQHWKKITSVRKGQCTMSPQHTENKAPPVSTFMVQGPAVTESALVGHLVCCFCGKWANYKNLGDLFGPFYTQEYVSTLSKNPPLKKSLEAPIKVKVRHKDALDGCKTDSDEEEEPQQPREQRSLSAHPRYKRRHRFGDFASSRHAVPSRMKTINPCELSLDSNGPSTADKIHDRGFQIPQLPLDCNEFWMHEGCVLWASGVYFVCGRLYGLQEAFDIAREMMCAHCHEPGATLGCYNKGCACCYHLPCAMDSECLLNEEDFSVRCPKHQTITSGDLQNIAAFY